MYIQLYKYIYIYYTVQFFLVSVSVNDCKCVCVCVFLCTAEEIFNSPKHTPSPPPDPTPPPGMCIYQERMIKREEEERVTIVYVWAEYLLPTINRHFR